MLKSLQNRKISYVKGSEANDLKQNLSVLTESFDLSRYGATSWYSAPNGGFAHDKVMLRAELEKGEYSVKVQAVSDTPELKKIVMFTKFADITTGSDDLRDLARQICLFERQI